MRGTPQAARRRAAQIIAMGLLGGPAIAFFGVIQGQSTGWMAGVLALSVLTVVLGIILLVRAGRSRGPKL